MWWLFRIAFGASIGLLAAEAIAAVQTNDAAAYWKFDEASSTSLWITNNHVGTNVSPNYTSGRFEDALSFSGSNSYVFISDDQVGATGTGLDVGTRHWTVSAWVKTTALGMVVTKM